MATKCLVCGFFAIFALTHLEKDILHQKHTTLLDVNDFRYSLYRSRFTLSREEAAQLRYLFLYTRDIVSVSVNGRPAKRLFPDRADAQSWTSATSSCPNAG